MQSAEKSALQCETAAHYHYHARCRHRDMSLEGELAALALSDTHVARCTHDVLNYWFPSRTQSLDHVYKKKWFAVNDALAAVDTEIRVNFSELLRDIEKLNTSGKSASSEDILRSHGEWLKFPHSTSALVVILDQFSRHVYRNDVDRDMKVEINDAVAIAIVEDVLDNKPEWLSELTVSQQVFLLMPFRHTQKSCPRLLRCLELIDARVGLEVENRDLLERFRKTTLRCYQDLAGKQHKHGDNILEREEFTPSEEAMQAMPSHALYKTIGKFMEENMRDFGNTIAVSLSGGVDSMVLAYILKHQGYEVVTLHLDYKNRPESTEEADFVADWSARHGMKFERRTVDQIRRGVTPREQYEIESRRIRYGFYKEEGLKYDFPAVLLGHHHGDVQENIITNLMRGANLLSVNGMGEQGIVEGVRIWRPMLPHIKDDVLDFAHTYGVPYFLDSTPTWSTRGKLRNQLVPLLEDMFGVGFLRNLSMIGENSEQLCEMVDESIFKPFWDATIMSDVGCYVDYTAFIAQPIFFWKQVIRETCHGLGTSMMKERSVRMLLSRIRRERSSKDGWMSLKKENATFVEGNTFAMFATEFMPRSELIQPGIKVIMDGQEHSFDLGKWSISLKIVSNVAADGSRRLSEPALDVWHVLQNDITYHIPFEQTPMEYVIDPEVRFQVTRGLDPAVRDAIPFIVPTEVSSTSMPGELKPARKMKIWSQEALAAPHCVQVTLKFSRTKLYVVADDDA